MRHTPLFGRHLELGASMLNLKGVARPVEYCGHVREHMATRNAVTLCDVSHMGEFMITGRDAPRLLQRMVVGNVDKLHDGKVMYSAFCNEKGHVLDDLVLMRLAADRWLMVVNVTMIEQDYQWVIGHNDFADAVVTDVSTGTALMALQGPLSRETLQKLVRKDLAEMDYYTAAETEIVTRDGGVVPCIISRTGYTGELGFEICCERDFAPFIWSDIMRAGRPFGIMGHGVAARESLRTEAGLLLNGNDMDGETTPYEAGIGWIVDLSTDFIGRDALILAKERGPSKKMVGLELDGLPTMRYGYPVLDGGRVVGKVTSGPVSVALAGRSLGLAYVEPDLAEPGRRLEVEILGDRWPVTVVRLPFRERRAKDVPTIKTCSPFTLSFFNEHVWCRKLDGEEYAIGLTEYAADTLGECLYFKAPVAGSSFSPDAPVAYMDSYRCLFPLKLPVAGTVIRTSSEAAARPAQVTEHPYCEEGLFVVKFTSEPQILDFNAYVRIVEEQTRYGRWSKAKRTV